MSTTFRAFVVNQTADGFKMGIQRLNRRDLPPGDALIQVAYSAVNYKDALVCIPEGKVARTYPLVPGLELKRAWCWFDVIYRSASPRCPEVSEASSGGISCFYPQHSVQASNDSLDQDLTPKATDASRRRNVSLLYC